MLDDSYCTVAGTTTGECFGRCLYICVHVCADFASMQDAVKKLYRCVVETSKKYGARSEEEQTGRQEKMLSISKHF